MIPKEKERTINSIVDDLKQIDNVVAVVLGGSYATGNATETSDIDLGIYYSEKRPFNINDIRSISKKYAVLKDPTVTGFYEWGRWVNGGAWIETSCGKVDFLYKNLEQISSTIQKAKNGEWENDFEQQPPYGFSSVIYLGEIYVCIPLYDSHAHIAHLKKEIQNYPPRLKESVIRQSLWSAEFAIWHAAYFFVKEEDLYNTAGCLTRAVKNIVTALFAINEIYPLGDKRAVEILEKVSICPPNLSNKINAVLSINKKEIRNNVGLLKSLFEETKNLVEDKYVPFPYTLKL